MSRGSEVGSEQLEDGRGKLPTERREALPNGWISVKFTDILGINGGSQPPKKDFIYEHRKDYVRLFQIRDFGEKPFPTYVPLSRKLRLVKKDELLLARYGGTSSDDSLGRVCTGMEGAYNVALVKLIFFKDLTPTSFIKHLFGAHFFLDVISKNSRSCQTGFNKGDLDDVSFPLPPRNEQKRIVAKLDKIMPRIDVVKERLDKVPAIVKRFRQSVLTAAVTGKLTEKWRAGKNLSEWEEKLSGELFSFVTSGSRGWAKYYSETGSLFLRIGNLDHFTINIDLQKKQYVKIPKSAEGIRTRVQPNDILISITADVGMIGLIPGNFEEAYINQHISLARPTKSVYPFYLAWYLSSAEGQFQFQEMQKGATKVGLGLDDIKNINIPLPLLEEQKEIVRQVDKLFALADRLESHYQKAKARVDKLSQSVLAKAFRGELVITEAELAEKEGRDFESAEKLLERILEEKAKLVGSRQRAVGGVRSARGSKGKQKETGGKKK